jgi:hypothetical protein
MKNNRFALQLIRRIRPLTLATLLLVITGCVHVTVILSPSCQTEKNGGRGGSGPGPNPGGTFNPVTLVPASGGGEATICTQSVSSFRVQFWTLQTPDPGYSKFYGYVRNDNTGLAVPNNQFILQWIVNSNLKGCCTTNINNSTWVTCPVTAGTGYRFTAHFLPGFAPPNGTAFSLLGYFIP